MRYRSIGAGRAAPSAVSLSLEAAAAPPGSTKALVFAALENGVNTFHVQAGDAERLPLLGEALGAVERGLVLVVLAIALDAAGSGQGVAAASTLREALHASGLGWIDAVILSTADSESLHPSAADAMLRERGEGRLRFIGVGGEGAGVDAAIRGGGLDLLSARHSLLSGWPERSRIKLAQDRGMSVLGHGFWGEDLLKAEAAPMAKPKRGLFGLGRRPSAGEALSRLAGYEFLETTPGWTAQEIALAYALTDPALSTVQIAPGSAEALERLAKVPEREMPTSLSAQIEMARFAAPARG